jgi:hypothetical protein
MIELQIIETVQCSNNGDRRWDLITSFWKRTSYAKDVRSIQKKKVGKMRVRKLDLLLGSELPVVIDR